VTLVEGLAALGTLIVIQLLLAELAARSPTAESPSHFFPVTALSSEAE